MVIQLSELQKVEDYKVMLASLSGYEVIMILVAADLVLLTRCFITYNLISHNL